MKQRRPDDELALVEQIVRNAPGATGIPTRPANAWGQIRVIVLADGCE